MDDTLNDEDADDEIDELGFFQMTISSLNVL